MTRHLFLTGEKGIGKSSLLKKLLPEGVIGGFFTVRTTAVFGEPSVHLLQPGQQPNQKNFLFFCTRRQDPAISARFDALGCAALAASTAASVLVMDELGPAECHAAAFRKAVWQALDGSTPIIGVLQRADDPFLQQIAQHDAVRTVTVTCENRDILAKHLHYWQTAGTDSYGAVVIEPTADGPMVLMVRSRKGWSFPKGHIESGETPSQTAVREIWEETEIHAAVDTAFSRTVPSILPGDQRSVTFFLGRSLEGLKQPIPHEVPSAVWVPAAQAAEQIIFPGDRAAFFDALAYWKSQQTCQ